MRIQDRERRKRDIDGAEALLRLNAKRCPQLNEQSASESIPDNAQTLDMSVQTELTMEDIHILEIDAVNSLEKICHLKDEVAKLSFNEEDLKNDEKKTLFYTGLPNFETLMAVFFLVEKYISHTATSKLSKWKQFLIVLMKLRLDLGIQDLGYRFGVSPSCVSRTLKQWVDVLYARLSFCIKWPDKEELILTMPMSFRKAFGFKVICIIDCFEIFIDKPSSLDARCKTYSSYKNHNTVKFLIGVTPQGTVSFISHAWGGRTSDKYITENSGFLDKLINGDTILADRGFCISESVGLRGAEVLIPAFTRGKDQLRPTEVEKTRKIASSRIHVERIIGAIRPNKIDFLFPVT